MNVTGKYFRQCSDLQVYIPIYFTDQGKHYVNVFVYNKSDSSIDWNTSYRFSEVSH